MSCTADLGTYKIFYLSIAYYTDWDWFFKNK